MAFGNYLALFEGAKFQRLSQREKKKNIVGRGQRVNVDDIFFSFLFFLSFRRPPRQKSCAKQNSPSSVFSSCFSDRKTRPRSTSSGEDDDALTLIFFFFFIFVWFSLCVAAAKKKRLRSAATCFVAFNSSETLTSKTGAQSTFSVAFFFFSFSDPRKRTKKPRQ